MFGLVFKANSNSNVLFLYNIIYDYILMTSFSNTINYIGNLNIFHTNYFL